MRGITFGLVAVLAITSVAFAQDPSVKPTLSVRADDYYVADGYKSFIVSATGTNINTLGKITMSGGSVYQVFTAEGVISPWVGDVDGSCPGNALDTYIMFAPLVGDPLAPTGNRLPDLPNGGTGGNPSVTTETITGGGVSGLGTFDNSAGAGDAYYLEGTPTDTELPVDLLHIVVADGKHVDVGLQLITVDDLDANPGYEKSYVWDYFGADIVTAKCPLDGDANEDGIVDLLDLDLLATNYNDLTGTMTWGQGDFTGEGNTDLLDLDAMATNYNVAADWYVGGGEGAAGVPEPGTIATLVAGLLCLAGYRLRK